jgi:hypothetical protein
LLVNEIAGNILEAVKIDGFDKGDAAKAAKLLLKLESANRREASQLNAELRGLYGKNYNAVRNWEARQTA